MSYFSRIEEEITELKVAASLSDRYWNERNKLASELLRYGYDSEKVTEICSGRWYAEAHMHHRHGEFTHEEIADLAYTIWQLAGEPEGDALANWYEAETILRSPITEVICDEQ